MDVSGSSCPSGRLRGRNASGSRASGAGQRGVELVAFGSALEFKSEGTRALGLGVGAFEMKRSATGMREFMSGRRALVAKLAIKAIEVIDWKMDNMIIADGNHA